MLSLRFLNPPLINKGLSSSKYKPFSLIPFDRIPTERNELNVYLSISLSKFRKVFANAAIEGGEEKGVVVGTEDLLQEEERLPAGLQLQLMPKHVAVIMDGNRRWARQKGLPMEHGHRAGGQRMRELTECCCRWGIKVLTVYAFSSENWIRPKEEVDFLMNLFEEVIKSDLERSIRMGIRVTMIGDVPKLPKSLQKLIAKSEEATKANSRLHLIIALNYSGRYDIKQACKSIACKVKDGLILPEDIDESLIEQQLQTNCAEFPHPDLLIRTSGEIRVSNFMLWQLAYTELHFVNALFPDFGEAGFIEALSSFQRRQRRFGGRSYGGRSS
ncbi:hypothetical protein F0562_001127 [Nyssa sinensis]|uniref:Alkyl transferase n=1 Tax=Nyssa sinensis TaxID=561372 RepID=A0A5J5C609_9ASTE|nr:hypothetical protein F0562_001127 [Nyssa sinensis]